MDTALTRLVGCRYPIQQAGMGGTSTVRLAAAVAEAGGLGTLGMPGASPQRLEQALTSVHDLTSGPVGVNFLMPFLNREAVEMAAGLAPLVEFFYGTPDTGLVSEVHAGGALAAWQVGSLDEAVRAEDAGCDLIIAQGAEAGGHVRGDIALLPLLDQILDHLSRPVIAAGGLATARTVAAVLAAGAAGARVGTRFVATHEADAHPDYQAALVAAGPGDAVLTTAFSLMWPDAPHRVLRASLEAAQGLESDLTGEVVLDDGRRIPVPRWSAATPGSRTTGRVDAMAQYAGQSVGGVRAVQSAADVVRELAEGAERLLRDRAT